MFCPKGPSVSAAYGSPQAISLADIDPDNAVLRLVAGPGASANAYISDPVADTYVDYRTYGESYFRIPVGTTSIVISAPSINTTAYANIGEMV